MELWIRSQKNEEIRDGLYKVNEIELGDYNENMDCLVVNNLYCIGIYKSKERALEVLDEIQNILEPKIQITNYEGVISMHNDNDLHIINPTYGEIKPLPLIVYNMPKE